MWPESQWTKPRPDCPHPEWWHAQDQQATEDEVTRMVAAMVTAMQPSAVVETGTHTGCTARAIGAALLANGHGALTTIEDNMAIAAEARMKLSGLPVTVVHGDALRVPVCELPHRIDMLWLDSAMWSTGKLHRPRELERFRPLLTRRAVVMVHDTGPHKAGHREALDKLRWMRWLHLPTPRGVSIGRPRG